MVNKTRVLQSGNTANAYMERYGVTPTTLAKMWGVPRALIYKIRNGRFGGHKQNSQMMAIARRMGYFEGEARPPQEYKNG